MLGFMTDKKALAAGYTNHGRMFGIPVWIGDLGTEWPAVAGKHIALDALLVVAEGLFGLFLFVCQPDDPAYPILVGPPIREEHRDD